mgnify:CR=1 FL=1
MQALDGIRVLDFTRVLSGPFATMTLADLGADVVKLEAARGDDTRRFGPPFTDEGVSTYYLSINRGKRSVVANLKDPADMSWVLELVDRADVVIQNFRPGVMDRLGLGVEALRARNRRLVYCSISAFGSDRPGAGYDLVVQGLSGIPHVTGDGSTPWKCGASIADVIAGMNAVQGVLAALLRRERTGEGAFVDVSMLDGQLAVLTYHASHVLNAGHESKPLGNQHGSIHPYGSYPASDGWLNVAVGNDSLFVAFCEGVGVAWHSDPRFADNSARVGHRAELDAVLVPLLATRTVADWLQILQTAGVPSGPICTVPQALERARIVQHSGGVRTLPPGFHIEGTPRAAESAPPSVGQHRQEVFRDWLSRP